MESSQTIQVCIVLTGQLARPVTFQVTTSSSTALAGILNDYINFDQTLETLLPMICIDIAINPDTVVENTEMFQVNLGSASDAAVNILLSTANVLILDSSTVDFRFSSSVYSVFENSSISVCAILEGSTVRNIAISLQLSSNGKELYVHAWIQSKIITSSHHNYENSNMEWKLMSLEIKIIGSQKLICNCGILANPWKMLPWILIT